MKKIIIFFLIFSIKLISQDIIDPRPFFIYPSDSTYLFNISQKFIKSWNWGASGLPLDSALLMNASHDFNFYDTNNMSNAKMIAVLWNTDNNYTIPGLIGRNENYMLNGLSLFLSPSIKPDASSNFVPRAGDKVGSVFGFKYHNNNCMDDSTYPNKVKLYKDANNTMIKVLDSIWDGTILHYLDYDGNHHGTTYNIGITNDTNEVQTSTTIAIDKAKYHPFNGKQFYLTINLKAIDSIALKAHLNDTILKIKLRYELKNERSSIDSIIDNWDTIWHPSYSYDYVKFDAIPDKNLDTAIQMTRLRASDFFDHSRGFYKPLIDISSSQDINFVITGRMLKTVLDTTASTKSVTLRALANFTGLKPLGVYIDNPIFRPVWWENRYKVYKYISSLSEQITR